MAMLMPDKCEISVIMPAYNAQKTIAASIESVLVQTYQNFELIIIDDASKDDTVKIVQEAAEKDHRIILLTQQQNTGVAQARNRGLSHAKGQWLAFLDADDLWREEKLKRQLQFMEKGFVRDDHIISYTATAYMDESGKMYDYILRAKKVLTYKDLLKQNLMSCSSVMVRRDVMIPFPDGRLYKNGIHEDYATWLTILDTHKICGQGLDEPLLIYRKASGSKSSNRISSAKMIYNAYLYVGFGRIRAGLLTLGYSVHSISKRMRLRTFN